MYPQASRFRQPWRTIAVFSLLAASDCGARTCASQRPIADEELPRLFSASCHLIVRVPSSASSPPSPFSSSFPVSLPPAAAGAAAFPHWDVSVRVEDAHLPAASVPVDRSGLSAISHVYNHVFGVASPVARDATDATNTFTTNPSVGLPVTDVFERPTAGLVLSVLGASSETILPPGASSSTYHVSHADASVAAMGDVLAHVAHAPRNGLSPRSIEVVGSKHALQAVDHAIAYRWDTKVGFTRQRGASNVHTGADTTRTGAWAGVLACSPAGKAVLTERLGWSVAAHAVHRPDEATACPRYVPPSSYGAAGVAHPVVFDPATNSADARALSEAALVVLLGDHVAGVLGERASDGQEGLLLNRLLLAGPAALAASHGADSDAYAAGVAALSAAVAIADDTMRPAAPPGRFATAVFGLDADDAAAAFGELASGGGEAHAGFVASHWAGLQSRSLGAAAAAASAAPAPANGTTRYTVAQVADYQVVLWTSVGLALVLAGTISALMGMDKDKDPALYTQVMDASAGRH